MKAIHLQGGSLQPDGNKGSALMLQVVSARMRSIRPDCAQAVTPGAAPFEERCRLGLRQLLFPKRWNHISGSIGYFALHRYRQQIGMVAEKDLRAVVNFAGYRYAYMGEEETEKDAEIADQRRTLGIKHVYLPQSYGPFHNENQRAQARRLFHEAELITARDGQSRDYLQDALGSEAKISVYPDITIGIPGQPSEHTLPEDFVAIIPNCWMLSRAPKEDQEAYLDFLRKVVRWIHAEGLAVVLLNHSPKQDQDVIDQLTSSSFPGNITHIAETDAFKLKGIIGRARFVVGSRYHALIGALSQNIPAIGTAWSHSFKVLFDDYGIPDCQISPAAIGDQLHPLLSAVATGPTRDRYVAALEEANRGFAGKTRELWERVEGIV